MAAPVAEIDDVGGDIDTLITRIASRIFAGDELFGQLTRGPALLLPDVRLAALG